MSQSNIAIVVDSTAQIPQELVQQHNLHVIPQILIWGQTTFYDDVDITAAQFYSRLETDPVFPTTSQATVLEFQELFARVGAGVEGILAIVLSSDLSGTLNSATQAKAALPGIHIELVDSRTVAMALGFVVLAAARAAEAGKPLSEVAQAARDCIDTVGVYLTVDNLEYLHRGGRIGRAKRFLGTALNIKPILAIKDGTVQPIDQVRTRKKAIRYLVDAVANEVEGRENIRLAALHAAAPADAATLLKTASERLQPVETHLAAISPVVGAHTGPGSVGLAWCVDG